MSGTKKKSLLGFWGKALLVIALILIVYYIFNKMGISITKVTDDTEIIDPYSN